MPLDKLVLILVCVVVAAGMTVWLGALIASAWEFSGAVWLILLPVGLVAWIVWRIVADRLNNPEDDHYDNIEK